MSRIALLIVMITTITLTGSAQAPPRGTAPQQAGTASLSGRVLAAGTNDPLRNARIQVASAVGSIPAVDTDADGRFVVPSLAAGQYRLSASKPGYVATSFGARWFGDFGTPVAVVNRAVDGVEWQLPKAAVISGRILDSRGDPALGLRVTAEVRSSATDGRPLVAAATTQTDDLGEYRLSGLPAGDALVVVNAGPGLIGPDGSAIRLAGVQMTATISGRAVSVTSDSLVTRIYYPGATNPGEAQAITLSAGDERTSVDFVLASSPPKTFADLARAPATATPGAPSTATIRGRITRTDGRPLPNTVVRLSGGFPPPTAITDDEGRFEILNVPAGRYRIIASRAGFITVEYGQRRPFETGEPIDLGPGESRQRIVMALPDPATITGHVVDDAGEAVEGADVRIMQARYQEGRRRLVEVAGIEARRTDDLGRYRLYGLPPGDYVVRALVGQLVAPQTVIDLPGYAPTYFPGTWNPGEAAFVTVGVAQQFSGVDFALARAPMARVSGRAVNAAGEPVQGGLSLSPSRRSGAVVGLSVGARIGRDGTFEFSNVLPGEYVLQSWTSRSNSWTEGEFATQFVSVTGSDVTGLVIRRGTGSTIRGRITLESGPPIAATQIELSAIPTDADLSPLTGNPPASAKINTDGTFEMAGVSGPRRLTLMRAPPGWTIKSVRLNGIDVTDKPVPFGTQDQSVADMEVVLTGRGAEVSGSLTDSRGQMLTNYTVIVFPTDRERWFLESRFLKLSAPGADGLFNIRSLPEGEYFVAAVDRLQPGEWQDSEFLESLVSSALQLTLGEGQKITVAPKLITR